MRDIPSKQYGLSVGRELGARLRRRGLPLREVLLHGSLVHGRPHAWSDIDLAVVCDPFLASKYDEQHLCSREARDIDVRAEVVCLHPEDFANKYFTLAQEVRRYGIAV